MTIFQHLSLRIHEVDKFWVKRQKVPMSAEGSMVVADTSESDVNSLRNTVAVLSAEVGGRGT